MAQLSIFEQAKDQEVETIAEGVLPNGWLWTTLGDVCTKPQYGYTTKASKEARGPRFLRITDLTPTGVNWESVPYCEVAPSNAGQYRLEDGDIVVSRAGSVGKAYLVTDPPEAVFASYLIRFRALIVSKKFVNYFLQSPIYWRQIGEVSAGITMSNVNAVKLSALSFPLPPLPEQERIVAAIEEQFTRLDAGVAALKRAQANLKRYKAAVLKAACEGALIPQDPSDEPAAALLARILAARRAKWEADLRTKGKNPATARYDEPAAPNTDALPALPDGWCWATVSQLGTVNEQTVLTGPFGSSLGRADFIASGVPVLTIGCLSHQGLNLDKAFFISHSKASGLERYRVQEGDLLFSRMASVGRADIVPAQYAGAIINYHLMRLRLSPSVIHPGFFITYVRGADMVDRYVKEVNHGATRDGINTDQLMTLPVSLPPLSEQERIAAEVEGRLSVVQEQETVIAHSLMRAERLRQAILAQAFAGRLVPQDPADEPASTLLNYIGAERNGTPTGRRHGSRRGSRGSVRAGP